MIAYDQFNSKAVNDYKDLIINQVLNGINNDEISVRMLLHTLVHKALKEQMEAETELIKNNFKPKF